MCSIDELIALAGDRLSVGYIGSMRFMDVKAVRGNLRLGGYMLLKVHGNLDVAPK
ncbi:hypothetical protein [Vulcanisaeta souniana]|uniref:Uncharacterized protein n=1 Tax=Vulcanisaeta souniana JCM 11219 TaxID=1293586 RepID=A0A830EFM1_9CREN|nr:hypothetical protein [Vulcanisaeta souniana]BDR93168.1 hypothetical protein Vsou_22610 [Vulcanisaeta souniana JCM 11219]GGI78185.1 hypothetical protein GCM10007112_13700 [Vulcanisaeta souniana JCM 11219]